jgi:glutaminyl-tRNA synthetase
MPSSGGVAARLATLVALDMDEKAAGTASQAAKTFDTLLEALTIASITNPASASCPFAPGSDERRRAASLTYTATTKFGDKKLASKGVRIADRAKTLTYTAIGDGRITGMANLEAAVAWLVDLYSTGATAADANTSEVVLDEAEFEEAAGVGAVVDMDAVSAAIDAGLQRHLEELVERRYRFNTANVQREVMAEFKFAEGKVVRDIIAQRLESILGPKTEADNAKPAKQKKSKPGKGGGVNGAAGEQTPAGLPERAPNGGNGVSEEESAADEDPFVGIPSSFIARDLKSAQNSAELLERRRAATGGKVVCRFPPEPNGYLHIGHAKAMFIDFGYAAKTSGETILRFDDTNPVAEKEEYVDSIIDMVEWMGHKPVRVTYSSDYFMELYELAKELIRRGKAYVCHQTGDKIKTGRENMIESPFRKRSIEENLKLFDDMRKGKYGEGEAILRMKIDMKSVNSVMRDPIAYRVLHSPHARTGDEWCIYPSYDYTHCIVDSLEWVTHSLCTLEFEIRRDCYYWLLEALDLYRPFVWEFARLSLEYTMMSKRKLKELVERGLVSGWDDPRMPTLSGMRRRGYPPSAINAFCAAIGASRAPNLIGLHVLEHFVRAELDRTCKRAFAVLRPLKVTISNFQGEEVLSVPNHPKNGSLGRRDLVLTKTVFIEKTDFRFVDEKNYFGLAPGKTAMLRYGYPISVDKVITDESGNEAVELLVTLDYEKSVKPKGVLHWVGQASIGVEMRMLSTLFLSPDPASLDKLAWLEDVNPKGLEVIPNALVEPSVAVAKGRESFQFERTGYFALDDDATAERPVFNLIVSLRDSRPVK